MLAIRAPPGSKVDFPNFNHPANKSLTDAKLEGRISKSELEMLQKQLDNKYHILVSSENLYEDEEGDENSGKMFVNNKMIDQ